MGTTVDPSKLSPQAHEHYEAQLFAETTPDFYQCTFNADTMLSWLQNHRLAKTYENFKKAFKALSAEGKILSKPAARAEMSMQEYNDQLQSQGVTIYDRTTGRAMGKAFPDEVQPGDLTEKPSDVGRVSGSWNQSAALREVFPNAAGYRPTRREYASWSAEKLRAWNEANDFKTPNFR
ncbi:MAG TPA: hypothetical protein VKV39_06635 [Candidatus Sulfotelmatobacter sp.]|nr:hypothetical protein [Candidatus Sulfotelmatobacter sp.]